LPLVLGPDHKKLSKRHGSTAVREFRDQGYIPEGLVNYLALLGWASGTEEEVFTMEELAQKWRIEHLQDSPAIWDKNRLDWFNGVHIRRLADGDLAERLADFLPAGASAGLIRAAVPLVQERIKTLLDAREMLEFLFVDDLAYDTSLLLEKREPAKVRDVLERTVRIVTSGPFTADAIKAGLHGYAEQIGWKAKDADMPVRIAVTGKKVGPPLFESMLLLGKDRTLRRLRDAIARLSDPVAA
jgi:glutamyl-tRNA synthetase